MRTNPLRGIGRLVLVAPLGLAVACGGHPAVGLAAAPEPVIPVATTSAPPTPMPKNPAPKPQPKPKPRPKPITGERLARAAATVEPNTTLGAVVFDRTTGRTPLSYHADRPFRSASLVKLLIAIDLLEQGSDAAERAQISRMLEMSDDGIASVLWVRDGGSQLVTRMAAELGLTGVAPPEVWGQWGEAVVTARDVVTVYRHVLALPPADRALIVDALAQAPEYAADGFDQYFGLPDGLAAQWAVKQGWGSNDTARVLHSTGLVGPGFRYVVVLLTEHPLGAGWQTCARSVTAAATAMHGLAPGI
jgi:hypothetical protein